MAAVSLQGSGSTGSPQGGKCSGNENKTGNPGITEVATHKSLLHTPKAQFVNGEHSDQNMSQCSSRPAVRQQPGQCGGSACLFFRTDAQPRSLTRQGATQFLLLLLRTDTCACRESGMAQLRPLALRLSHPGLQSSEDNWQGSASKLTSTVAGRIQLLTGRSTEAVCWLDITFSLSSCSSVTSRSGSRALPLWPPPHLSSTKVC
nr:uncharacterized protein LOC128779467 isoform X2 [Desmodus rotundus]